MSAPVMALLPDLGLVTAVLSTPQIGGFGNNFGENFGVPIIYGTGDATLAGNGVSTATTTPQVLVTAQIQLA